MLPNTLLFASHKAILQPFHIKQEVMNKFVKAMNKKDELLHVKPKLAKISDAKLNSSKIFLCE